MAKKVELKPCEYCGEKPEIITEELPSLWEKDKFFTVYKVVCKNCRKTTILSQSENTVKKYWNNGDVKPMR